MSFLTPAFFLGLGALAIPILVHLIQREKKRVVEFPVSRRGQLEAEPVYESFPGFSGDLKGVRKFDKLPLGARRYVLAVETWARLRVVLVGAEQEIAQLRARASALEGKVSAATTNTPQPGA